MKPSFSVSVYTQLDGPLPDGEDTCRSTLSVATVGDTGLAVPVDTQTRHVPFTGA